MNGIEKGPDRRRGSESAEAKPEEEREDCEREAANRELSPPHLAIMT
jgi:hypothetical protein